MQDSTSRYPAVTKTPRNASGNDFESEKIEKSSPIPVEVEDDSQACKVYAMDVDTDIDSHFCPQCDEQLRESYIFNTEIAEQF